MRYCDHTKKDLRNRFYSRCSSTIIPTEYSNPLLFEKVGFQQSCADNETIIQCKNGG